MRELYHLKIGYNTRVELPTRCSCGQTVMVDLENLEIRPISKIYCVEGFICEHCKRWEAMFFTTVPLEDGLRKLEKLSPLNRSFRYHFSKILKRAEVIQHRGKEVYGALRIPDPPPA